MPIEVEIDGVGTAEFPDDTPIEVIQSAVKRTIASKTTPQQKLDSAVQASSEIPDLIERDTSLMASRASVSTSGVGPQGAGIGISPQAREQLRRDINAYAGPAGAIVGGLLTGGAAPLAMAAGTGLGGLIGSEAGRAATGEAPLSPGEIATTAVGSLPTGVAGGLIKQGVANAVQQVVAKQIGQNVQQAAEGQPQTLLPVSELVSPDVLVAGAAPAVAQGVNRGLAAVETGAEALRAGATVREAAKAATVGAARPTTISPEQEARNQARTEIESLTGQRVPVTVSEAVGRFDLARANQEITPEAQATTQRLATWAAARHPELASLDVAAKAEFIQKAVQDEGFRISDDVARSVAASTSEIGTQLGREVAQATPASMSESVNRLRSAAETGLNAAKAEYNAAYEKARNTSGFANITVTPAESTLAAFKILESPGITIDPKVKRVMDVLDDGLDYDQAKNLKTFINDSIGNESLLPGISDGQKKLLAGALAKDMADAISENPKAAALMREADTKFAKAQESFNTLFAKQTVRETGEEGGATAGTIVSKLSGRSGDDFLKQLRSMEKYNPNIITEAKDSVVANIIETKGSNAAGVLDSINKMAPAIRSEFFPNLKQIEALAGREAALADLPSVDGKALLAKIKDTDSFVKALTEGGTGVRKTVSDLLQKTADDIAQFKNRVIQDASLADKNPIDFVDGVTTGRLYSDPEIRGVMDKLPDTARADVQRIMVERVLSEAGGDAGKLSEILNNRFQGPRVDTVLGKDTGDFLRSTADNLKRLQPTYRDKPENISLLSTLTQGAGVGAAVYGLTKNPIMAAGAAGATMARDSISSALPRLTNIGAEAKFKLASRILSTPELREIAVTPLSRLDPEQVRLLGAFLAEQIREQ